MTRRPRALYLTPITPSHRTGGGRHALANLRALCDSGRVDIDYVGPPFDPAAVDLADRLRVSVARPFGARDKLRGALVGAATGLRGLLVEHLARHPPPDLALLESTLCGFAVADLGSYWSRLCALRSARWPASQAVWRGYGLRPRPLPRGDLPHAVTACVVHNVEADYSRLNHAPLAARLRAPLVAHSERLLVRGADALLVLHATDRDALRARYGPPRGDVHLHPACAFAPPHPPRPMADRPRQLAFIGSLDIPYNHDAIMAFLAQAWPRLTDLGHRLLIAGWRPRPALRAAVAGADGVTLLADAPDIAAVLRDCRALVLPDRSGTGMKLRVAEALSHGVPVVGTAAGLRGYEPEQGTAVLAVPTVAALVGPLRALLTDTPRLEALAAAAHDAWRTRLAYAPFAARLDALLARLLARARPGPGRAR